MKRKRLLLKVIIIGLPITVFLLWITGAINLWFYGMGDISDNVKFYSLELKPIDGEYSVLIDLSDLESNRGKILYDDGEHQIYISDVFISNEENYEVFLDQEVNIIYMVQHWYQVLRINEYRVGFLSD